MQVAVFLRAHTAGRGPRSVVQTILEAHLIVLQQERDRVLKAHGIIRIAKLRHLLASQEISLVDQRIRGIRKVHSFYT